MKKSLAKIVAFAICLNFLSVTSYAVTANKTQIQKSTSVTTSVTEGEASLSTLGFDVTKLGAKGSDKIDDTDAIQRALNQYDKVYIPDGTYMINVEKSLKLKSNQTLTLSKGAILQALPTSKGNSSVLTIANVSGVTVSGGQIIGERSTHKGTTGEWGMGILIDSGANNVSLKNINVSNCWGDGLYLGGEPAVNNIKIDGITSSNNRRQGLSITNATQVTISNSIFKNTNGVAPEAGIDIEPNAGQKTDDITIINTQCYGNVGSGIELIGLSQTINRVVIKGCTLKDNLSYGIGIFKANDITVSDTQVTGNIYGIDIPRDASNIKFTNMTISYNRSRGVSIVASEQATGISNITFENSTISNNSQDDKGSVDGVRIDNSDLTSYVKNITFTGCRIFDDQAVKTQRYGITVGFSQKISDILIAKSNVFSGNIYGDYLGSNKVITVM